MHFLNEHCLHLQHRLHENKSKYIHTDTIGKVLTDTSVAHLGIYGSHVPKIAKLFSISRNNTLIPNVLLYSAEFALTYSRASCTAERTFNEMNSGWHEGKG